MTYVEGICGCFCKRQTLPEHMPRGSQIFPTEHKSGLFFMLNGQLCGKYVLVIDADEQNIQAGFHIQKSKASLGCRNL